MINQKIWSFFLLLLVVLFLFTGCSSNTPINSNNNSSNPIGESYALTVITEGEGNVIEEEIINTADYENGTEVKLTAVTDETNWLFSHWEGDYTGNENPIEVIMDGNKTITAVFQSTVLGDNQPYEITNWHQLNEVRNNLDAQFILMENLNSSSLGYIEFVGNQTRTSEGWNPIGVDTIAFSGLFDGNDKMISDLYINRSDVEYVGLFGANEGKIENLGVEVINITGYNGVAGLVAYNAGDILNCNVSGTIEGNDYVGGLVGYHLAGTIDNCYVKGDIYGNSYLGGLIGLNEYNGQEVLNSYIEANVTGENDYIGGIIGYNGGSDLTSNYANIEISGLKYVGGLVGYNEGGIIDSCYTNGSINGNNTVGGLVGFNESTEKILNSYVEGRVEGEKDFVGGLIGNNEGGIIEKCYVTGDIFGESLIGGLIGSNSTSSEILKSYAQTDVTGKNDANYIGGLVGYNGGLVRDCYAIGRIYGYSQVGGLIGYMDDLLDSNIERSYSAGEVIGGEKYGGLIGYNMDETYYNNVSNSYWNIETGSGINHSEGGEGKTTTEMSQEVTFVGWDFTNNWDIEEGETYPYLKWQADKIPNIPNG